MIYLQTSQRNMELRQDYSSKITLNRLTEFSNHHNLTQVVDFNTWSRTIKGVRKESLIDHVYTDDVTLIKSLTFETPTFGDHLLIITELELRNGVKPKMIVKRNWNNYSRRTCLISNLVFDTDMNGLNVQSQWNYIENVIINAVDILLP